MKKYKNILIIIICLLILILSLVIVFNVFFASSKKTEEKKSDSNVEVDENYPSTKSDYLKYIKEVYGSDGCEFKVQSDTKDKIIIQKIKKDSELVTTYEIDKKTGTIIEENLGTGKITGK